MTLFERSFLTRLFSCVLLLKQSNIETSGFRSLREGEEVEFDLVIGEDGKKKAFNVTGPDGAPPLGSSDASRSATMTPSVSALGMGGSYPHMRQGGRGMRSELPAPFAYPAPGYGGYMSPHAASPGQSLMGMGGGGGPSPSNVGGGTLSSGGRGRTGMPPPGSPYAPFAPGAVPDPAAAAAAAAAYMGYYSMNPAAASGGAYPTGYITQPVYPRSSRGFFPGGQNWAGARPPPPGTPGFSSGLQVVVHNLPWDCTWQQLKDAFDSCGEIERADVVFDSRGRSRGFGIVRFLDRDTAEAAVEKMNNASIGGRVVSVRIDRFA